MRKKIEPDIICKECGTRLKFGKEAVFCDYCKNKLKQEYPLSISVFWKSHTDQRPDSVELCSWSCVADFLRNFPWNKKEVEFICLPYIAGYSKGTFTAELKDVLKAFSNDKTM